jgi:methionyl-tRNA formyltransferase|tara:strand:- start:357 stop:1034 length:678 start_codon:yes stop_codon:yes gene_type:complete
MLGSVLFFGRKNCLHSYKIKKFLKRKSKRFYYVESSFLGEELKIKKLEKISFDYIFCFRSFYILKKKLINNCKIAAINFHPGTPKYRGIGCVNFALYNDEKFYGCTAHIVNQKIDNGKILDVRKFQLKKKDTVESCLEKTYKIMFNQAFQIINLLITKDENLTKLLKKNTHIKWSKKLTTKKDLDKLYIVNKKVSKKQLKKIIRATNTNFFKPYISLHKKKFYFK